MPCTLWTVTASATYSGNWNLEEVFELESSLIEILSKISGHPLSFHIFWLICDSWNLKALSKFPFKGWILENFNFDRLRFLPCFKDFLSLEEISISICFCDDLTWCVQWLWSSLSLYCMMHDKFVHVEVCMLLPSGISTVRLKFKPTHLSKPKSHYKMF